MKALIEAVYAKFTHVTMPLFFHRAPTGRALPYCVFFFINSLPEYSFSSVTEENELQFSVFAETGLSCLDLMEDIKNLFDDCILVVSGYQFVKMERVFAGSFENDHEHGSWQGVITYNVFLHKDNI